MPNALRDGLIHAVKFSTALLETIFAERGLP